MLGLTYWFSCFLSGHLSFLLFIWYPCCAIGHTTFFLEFIAPFFCLWITKWLGGIIPVTFSRLEPEGKLIMGGRKASAVPSLDQVCPSPSASVAFEVGTHTQLRSMWKDKATEKFCYFHTMWGWQWGCINWIIFIHWYLHSLRYSNS